MAPTNRSGIKCGEILRSTSYPLAAMFDCILASSLEVIMNLSPD